MASAHGRAQARMGRIHRRHPRCERAGALWCGARSAADAFSGNVKGHGPGGGRDGVRRATERAVPLLCRGQDRSGRLQPAAVPHVRRSDDDPRLDPLTEDGAGVSIRHHGCEPHRRAIASSSSRRRRELYDIAALLRDPERYVVESVWSRATGEQAAAVATSRLHNIAGKYTGKDDPVMLVRTQMNFPATGEILAPYAIGHFVAGGMRGSHNMPLMPVPLNTGTSYFDGPPLVSCAAFAMHEGKLTEALDASRIRSGTRCAAGSPARRWRCGGRASSARPCCR